MLITYLMVSAVVIFPVIILGVSIFSDIISYHSKNKHKDNDDSAELSNNVVVRKEDFYHTAFEKVHNFDRDMSATMFKIHLSIRENKLTNYDRFYTVYCKEISDVLDTVKNMSTPEKKSKALHHIFTTYSAIFNTMLDNIHKDIENKRDISADIEGVKNFATTYGDYDDKNVSHKKERSDVCIDSAPKDAGINEHLKKKLTDTLDEYVNYTGGIITYRGRDLRDIINKYDGTNKDDYECLKDVIEWCAIKRFIEDEYCDDEETNKTLECIINENHVGLSLQTYVYKDGSSDSFLVNRDATVFSTKPLMHKDGDGDCWSELPPFVHSYGVDISNNQLSKVVELWKDTM